MEWYKGVWCLTMDELTRDDRTDATPHEYLAPIVTPSYYKQLCHRKKLIVVRRGGGASCPALIEYDSLPEGIKRKVDMKYPDMVEAQRRASKAVYKLFRQAYAEDMGAYSHYVDKLRQVSATITTERIRALAKEYSINASVIQAVVRLRSESTLFRKVRQGRRTSWADMAEAIAFYKEEVGHTLGTSPTRFAQWVRSYEQGGYDALISKKFGNMNTLKLSVQVERLLYEMACDEHRPYDKTVWQWYCAFLRGEKRYYNQTTGELYDPAEYPDLSEKSVNEYLKTRLSQARLSKHHDALHDYRTGLRPSHKRKKPKYALSMVSLDDKDFGIKIHWTKEVESQERGKRVRKEKTITALKAYICYDVASQCAIGWAFSGNKDRDIFEGCVRSMYRNLLAWGLGQPYEAQVENHLVSLYKETMMKEGNLFPCVSWAGAENSQEKYAEHNNRILKYQFEKMMVDIPIGRPYAKMQANKTKGFTAHRDKEGNVYVKDFAEACRLYDDIIEAYNNALHSEQKLYPGKTRKEVLMQCVHPDIKPIDRVQMARWAGLAVRTSVVRGRLRANYEDYAISPEAQERLKGRKGRVTAYHLPPQEGGVADEVYLFQEDIFLEVCPRIIPYQVSKLERTAEDIRLLGIQQARGRAWDEAVDKFTPEGLGCIESEAEEALKESKPVIVPVVELQEDEAEAWASVPSEDYVKRAISEL